MGVAGGPIPGPAGADVSSSEGVWNLNARGGDVALVLARKRVAGWAGVTGFEWVARERKSGGEESEEEDGCEHGLHGWRVFGYEFDGGRGKMV